MSSFPNFSNIAPHVQAELASRKGNIMKVSNLNAWVRVASGVGGGCQIISNPNFALFGAVGSIYGDDTMSGTLGYTWSGNYVVAPDFHGYRPKPNITSIEIDEGAGNISRKATFSITCYTRAQLDTMCKYYLEPGYTIFLEWGWNTPEGVSQFVPTLSGDSVGANQSFTTVSKKRKDSSGHYDNYLGFITGGSVSMSGQEWTITVKCTGFTELPAFLNAADNTEGKTETTNETAQAYDVSKISAEPDLGKQRFMMGFNRLPSNKQSKKVQDLITDAFYASPLNFVNVDENVKAEMNSKMKGTSFLGFTFGGGAQTADTNAQGQTTNSGKVDLPEGTDLIGDAGFIKFGVLSGILSQIGFEAYKVGPNLVSVSVNTKNTTCAAFPKIFSTDKNKLFIPNPNTPKFSLLQASEATTQTDFTAVLNCSVEYNGAKVIFPYDQPIVKGTVAGRTPSQIQYGNDETFLGLNKDAYAYGFLDDLYVNLEFAKGILETKNFSIKDALYQLLNGISGAAGGMWDFQIQEQNASDGSTELVVVDLNMASQTNGVPYRFDVAGADSIFMDASLDLDISGAKMNQIIGNRLGQKVNNSQPQVNSKKKAGLFTDEPDLVLTSIKKKEGTNVSTTTVVNATKEEQQAAEDEAKKKAKEKAMQLFLSRIGYAPKVELLESADFGQALEAMTYITAYNDQLVFESLKNGKDMVAEAQGVSALMPIKFSFTIHGVSGIKRGDKFRVGGIPKAYEETGFFQVTSVKHTITDMIWKTEIEGGFRLQR